MTCSDSSTTQRIYQPPGEPPTSSVSGDATLPPDQGNAARVQLSARWVAEGIRFAQDPTSSAEIEQLTSQPVTSTNIYCEKRFASSDGRRIAISRKPFGQPGQVWVCDLESMSLCRAITGRTVAANAQRDAIYYIPSGEATRRLMRLNLAELTIEELLRFPDGKAPSFGAVSPDERWFVGGGYVVQDNLYSLRRTSLETGQTDTLCEIEDMFNPHLQFDLAGSGLVSVQINRGGQTNPTDGKRCNAGPLGATLCLVDIESKQVHPLPVGRPHTPKITGHECWAGQSGELLFTAGQYQVTPTSYVTLGDPPEAERDMPLAAIYAVSAGSAAARVVAQGRHFNHLAASDDGRFFIADDHPTGRIYVGNIATGRYLPLCDSHTRQGACQYSHVHAYMTPDNRYVIFNSIVTGVGQVYAARIPEGFLEQVESL